MLVDARLRYVELGHFPENLSTVACRLNDIFKLVRCPCSASYCLVACHFAEFLSSQMSNGRAVSVVLSPLSVFFHGSEFDSEHAVLRAPREAPRELDFEPLLPLPVEL